jgi:hypothetical protein
MTDQFDEDETGGRLDADTNADGRFVERISVPLRAPERLGDSFEARVMSAAHAEVRAGFRAGSRTPTSVGWWRRPRTVAVSPLAGVAMAAGFLGVAVLGDAALRSALRPAAVSESMTLGAGSIKHDTVHMVRFVITDSSAKSISLVGDFNDWSRGVTRLTRTPNGGAWIVSVPLPPGRHEYAFLVTDDSGEHWVADPFATKLLDEFGTESSLLQVGGDAGQRATSTT